MQPCRLAFSYFAGMYKHLFAIFASLLLLSCSAKASVPPQIEHPRLFVNQQEIDSLVRFLKKEESTWLKLTNSILPKTVLPSNSKFGSYAKNFQIALQCWTIEYLIGNQERLPMIIDTLHSWEKWGDSLDTESGKGWGYYVLPGSAFITSLTVLDLIWNDLDSKDQKKLYTDFEKVVVWFQRNKDPHHLNRLGIDLAWAIFTNNSVSIDTTARNFRDFIDYEARSGGVHGGGSSYAWQRLAGDRLSKALGIPLLLRHKPDIERDADVQNLYRYLFCASVNTNKSLVPFGDSGPNSMAKASPIRWFAQGKDSIIQGCTDRIQLPRYSKDYLFDAIFQKDVDSKVLKNQPKSFVFGGGYIHLGGEDITTLSADLWNPLSTEWHSHPESNGLYLFGDGTHQLMGTGYAGAKKSSSGLSWAEIHSTPRMGNILLPATDTSSDGIAVPSVRTILTEKIEIAQSSVLFQNTNQIHIRSLIRIFPNDMQHASVLVIDELRQKESHTYEPLFQYWHPYGSQTSYGQNGWWFAEPPNQGTYKLGILPLPTPSRVELFNTAVVSDNKKYNRQRISLKVSQNHTTNPSVTLFSLVAEKSPWVCNNQWPIQCQNEIESFRISIIQNGILEFKWIQSQNEIFRVQSTDDSLVLWTNNTKQEAKIIPVTPREYSTGNHFYSPSLHNRMTQ